MFYKVESYLEQIDDKNFLTKKGAVDAIKYYFGIDKVYLEKEDSETFGCFLTKQDRIRGGLINRIARIVVEK